jgi:hypothetical protein
LFEGLIYQFAYNLERHRLFNIRLRRWLILLCLVLPAAIWLKVWAASRGTAVLVTLGAGIILAAVWWAGHRRYMRFAESPPYASRREPARPPEEERPKRDAHHQPASPLPTDSSLPAMARLRVRATGLFEVSGMRRYFVETPANYTTFETCEHCVMTQIPLTRFLLVGKSNEHEVGWWYTFFQPWMIRSVACGMLYFGLHQRPALRLEIVPAEDARGETLYLSFDDEAACSLVRADLTHDSALD